MSVKEYRAEAWWKKYLVPALVLSWALTIFVWMGADSVTKGRILLFAFVVVCVYIGGKVIESINLPKKYLDIGEKKVVAAAQKYFTVQISMADCKVFRPISSREILYEFHVPGDGQTITIGWDKRDTCVSREEVKTIDALQRDFDKSRLYSSLLSGQTIRDRAIEEAERQGLRVPGLEEES